VVPVVNIDTDPCCGLEEIEFPNASPSAFTEIVNGLLSPAAIVLNVSVTKRKDDD
jgi:hypothetical protein